MAPAIFKCAPDSHRPTGEASRQAGGRLDAGPDPPEQQLREVSVTDRAAGCKATDTAIRLKARLFRDRREVRLNDGQAMFSVNSDTERPIHVRAGLLPITVLRTRFSVRHTASGLVQRGEVREVVAR